MADQIKKLSAGHTAEVLDGIMSEVEEARGEHDNLGERLDEMSSDTPTPSTAAPAMDGTAAAGTSTDYARADHIHPSDTSKQDTLTTVQLAAVNSGINSTKVEQIEANKNNISSLVDAGAKNLFDFEKWANSLTGATRGTITIQSQSITLTATGNDAYTMPQTNGFHVAVNPDTDYVVTVSSSNSNGQLVLLENDAFSKFYALNTNGGVSILSFTTSSTADRLSLRFGVPTSGNESTISDVMICTAEEYASSPKFVPYAMTNAELTAAIQALQAQLANQ